MRAKPQGKGTASGGGQQTAKADKDRPKLPTGLFCANCSLRWTNHETKDCRKKTPQGAVVNSTPATVTRAAQGQQGAAHLQLNNVEIENSHFAKD